MRKLLSLWALLALLLPLATQAQQTLTVADGTASNDCVPFQGFNADNAQHNQVLYPASMLTGMSGNTVTQMVFYIDSSASNGSYTAAERMGTWTVSLGETTETSLSNLNTTTTLTQVYEGYFDCSSGTLTIEFDEPYVYNGGNLLLDINHAAASWNRWYFLGISSTGSAYTYGSQRNFLPKTTFTYTTGPLDICFRPKDIAVVDATTSSVTLSWIDTSNASASYNLQAINGTDTLFFNDVSSPYTAMGLSSGTSYTFRLQSDCGSSQSAWIAISTLTNCDVIPNASLPWNEGFESYTAATYSTAASLFTNPCWNILDRYSADYPHVITNTSYSTYVPSGSNALCLYGSSTTSTILVLPAFEATPDQLQIDFLVRTSSTGAGLEVGIMSNPTDASTFVSVASCIPSASFTNEHYDVTFAGHTEGRIALRYTSTGYGSVYLDSITVQTMPDCTRPSSVTVSDLTTSSVTIDITDANNVGSYAVILNGDSTVINSGTLYIDTLSPNTNYTVAVRTLCTDGSTTEASTLSFRTPCAAQSIPDTIDFEDATPDAAPACWTPLGGDVFVRNSTSNSRNGSMYLDFRGTRSNMIALPNYEDDISGLQVRFWTRPENFTNANCGTFEVGYITNLTDTSTFSPIVSYTYSDFTAYEEKEVSFASAPSGAYIAFLHKANATGWFWYVDDIIVEPISSCPRPASVDASAVGSDEATITVNDPTDHGTYQYTLYVNDTTQVTSDVFSGTTTTIYSLSPNTVYRVDVAASCGSEVSNPVSTTFRTQCVALTSTDLPYEMDFNEVATNAMPDCWTKLNLGGTSYQNYPFVTTNTNPDGTSGSALYFYAYATTQREYAIMPTVDDLSGLMVSFFAKGSTSQSVTVGIMEDPTDTTTFTALQTIPMTSSSNWTNHEVSFDSYTGSGLNVAFRVSGTGAYNSLYIDDVALLAAPACQRPQGVSVRAITTNSATLHIDDTNLVGNYNILLISGSDTTTLSSTDTVYYLTGLNHSSGYKVIVNAVCSDASVTTSVSTNFFTECELISTFPYTENFDSWATGDAGVPNCWNRYYYNGYSGSTTSHPYASSDEHRSGSNALRLLSYYYFDYYDYYEDYEYSASFMPEFSVPLNGLTMSFWYKAKPYYASNVSNISLAVGVSQSTGDTSTFTRLLTILPTDTAWHEYDLDLSSYTGTGTRITFLQLSDDGYSDYGYSDYGYIDDITVDQLGDCARPATVSVSSIDTTSALISWTDINETGSYSVRWTDSDSITVTNDLSYTLTGLTPATVYTVTVRRICDDASLTGAREVTFQTALVPIASLPYSTGFEASDDTDWQFITGNANPWTIGSATANGGTQSLYISNDGGTSNAYTVSTATINFAARNFDLAEGEYALSFDWKAAGESNYDFIRVFVCHDSVTPDASLIPSSSISTATPAGWQDVVGGKLNLQGANWQNANGTFNIAEAGLYKVVFMWRNDGSGGTQPPAAIDNVTLAALACPAPVNLVVDSLTATSATLRWSATGEETAWIVSINGEAWQQVSNTTLALSGLTPSSAYSVVVRALCSATDTSFALSGNFTTACGAITTLPWSEDFDALTDINQLQCWDRYTGLYTGATTTLTPASSGWVFSTANVLGGTNHLRVNVFGNNQRWIVTPEFALTSPAKLTFNYALTAYYSTNPISTSNSVADDRFLVLVTTDGGSSWTPIATWDSTGAAFANIPNTGDSASLSLSAYTGQNIRIAFYTESILTGGDNDLHIDNIAITLDTTAPAPTTYTVTLATADAAMGSVSPAGNTTVVENGSFTATATANAGYRFVAWTDAAGATVSTANPYTFTVTANTALTATFEATVTTVTVSVTADETMGSVLGAGTYESGAQVTLTATANTGYHFVAWMDGATQVSTANPYVFTATADVNLSAIFAADGTDPDQYTVTVNYDATRGTVTGAGTYLAGTSVTLVATSNPGYRFAGWSNGVADSNYTFTVTENVTLTANFAEVVGIQTPTSDLQPSIYPNPATTTVTLTCLEPGAQVTIVDLNGREISKFKIQNSEFEMDVTSLASGAYYVRITGQRQQAVRKLIVK